MRAAAREAERRVRRFAGDALGCRMSLLVWDWRLMSLEVSEARDAEVGEVGLDGQISPKLCPCPSSTHASAASRYPSLQRLS